jgi:hypothetical protein
MGETTQTTPGSAGQAPRPAPAETPRPAPARPAGAPAAPPARPAGAPAASFPGPAAFRAGSGPEDRLIGQVAFAMAAEAGQPPRDAEAMQALRDQATTALSDFAFRYLHNRVEEIRREAAEEAASKASHGPGLGRLVLANLIGLAIAGGVVLLLLANPHLLAGLGGH